MRLSILTNKGGYAAITSAIFTLAISLTIISAFTFFTLQEVNTNRAYVKSIDAHYISESGIEDAAYRIITGKQIASSQDLGVGSGITTVSVTTSGTIRTIRSEGIHDSYQRNLETTVDVTTSAVNFHYGVQVGDGGLTMDKDVQIIGNIYSNGNVTGTTNDTVTGDVIVAGGIDIDPQVEWPAPNSDQPFATTTASRDIAQSFTATETGAAPKVSVILAKVGSPSSDITLRIVNDNSGKPSASSLASATIKNSSVGITPSWIDAAFSSPPSLTNGATYWIVLDYGSNSSTDYWNWRKDDTDAYADNTGKYADNWSSGGATWRDTNADLAFKVWTGGTNTKIENVIIGDATSGTGRANIFVNDTIHGSACPNAYCIIENPARAELPISDGVIQDWKNEAAGGTIINGDYTVSGSQSLGPAKINGNLDFAQDAVLTITGTIWVTETIDISRDATIKLDTGYGSLSGILMGDDLVDVKKESTFQGSGTAGSYVLLMSTKNAPASTVIDIDKSSSGVIYYAGKGRMHLHKDSSAKEITAYGIDIDKDSTITYDS
ncbi:MAG: choice-of-anchor R domain-containing protein, partial [Candidatus Sungbacteria bacterium]|nr:choice-of-anchor R domain-containing protein [Candidatus Sungbacteria bacterium]